MKEQNLISDVVAKASHLTLGYCGFLGLDADGYELFKLSKERGRSSLPDRGKLTYEEHNITYLCCIIGSTNPCRITRKVEQMKCVLCTLRNLF